MKQFIVTVKLAKHPLHDPAHKITGICPLRLMSRSEARMCSDTTGAHHSMLVEASSIEEVQRMFQAVHVTRVEEMSS